MSENGFWANLDKLLNEYFFLKKIRGKMNQIYPIN